MQNPEFKSLQELKITIKSDGVIQTVPALDKHWVTKKYFLIYEPPNLIDSDGREVIGAKERWLELACFITDDLIWLLRLPFHKFWSNIVYNTSIMNSIITFLQDAPTFCTIDNFSDDPDIREHFSTIRKNILNVCARLVTIQESSTEYMNLSEYARLIYDKYVFTIPTLMDICQQYGRDNRQMVEKIINHIFTSQPLYKEDLEKTRPFIMQALYDIKSHFKDYPGNLGGAIPLLEKSGVKTEISLSSLEDTILYLLDIVSTLSIFFDIYSPGIHDFKVDNFMDELISVYSYTVPEMYNKLNYLALKDETIEKHNILKHKLDVARIEILRVYRFISYVDIDAMIKSRDSFSPSEMETVIGIFVNDLEHTLFEKAFVLDYYSIYPITEDFQNVIDLYPDFDQMRFVSIIDSILTYLDEKSKSNKKLPDLPKKCDVNKIEAGPSFVEKNHSLESKQVNIAQPSKAEMDSTSLISEVRDILCDLGEGFIEICLKHYNYNKESVINAVLEGSLPLELENLDHSLPLIPPDPEEASAAVDAAIGMQRLNVYDNDEFDVMTKDFIDTSKIHKGKRKDKYKNLNELLNDKSHIAGSKDFYNKYSIVTSEYDDEYDDTYDDQDIGSSAQDDAVEIDRPFITPRVLQSRQRMSNFEEIEEGSDNDSDSGNQMNKDNFAQDPALLRARAEERRQSKQGVRIFSSKNRNVVGNAKGQGQTKEVTDNRNQKNKSKASRANHNRRAGSQWKHSHGMIPS